ELVGRVVSMQIRVLESATDLSKRQTLQALALKHTTQIAERTGTSQTMLDQIYQPVRACGVALIQRSEILTAGDTPPIDQLREALPASLPARHIESVIACERAAHPLLQGRFAGLMLMPAPASSIQALIWFRHEVIEEVRWSGDPRDKTLIMVDGRPTIEPRNSFKAWKEDRGGLAPRWLDIEMDYATSVMWAFSRAELLDRIELAAELAQERTLALKRANRDLERFTYSLAHDLKTPVRGVAIGLGLLEEKLHAHTIDEDTEEILKLMRERIDRLSIMLRAILDYADTGKPVAKPASVDIAALVRDVVQQMTERNHVKLHLDITEEQISFPPGTIDRVLQNLVENAVRHHDRDDINIEVQAALENGRLDLRIIDDGPGIPIHFHRRAFDMFARGRHEPGHAGTGLGLGIVRRIIEALGGTIAIRSDPEVRRGTALEIHVPCQGASNDR
ncbi:MAG: ATP-binding protein, partial [Pseudomonadota bacterium]